MIDLEKNAILANVTRIQAEERPGDVAFVLDDEELTYGALDRRASQVANGLISLGVKPDHRIGYIGKNSISYFEVLFGALKARSVMVSVNWRLAEPEIEYVLKDADVEIFFVGAEYYDLVASLQAKMPQLRQIIAIDGGHDTWPDYATWRDGFDDTDPMLAHDPDDDVIQLYTSGTTGHPKGVQLTNRAYQDVFRQAVDAQWADWTPGTVNFVCMPLFHVAGVNIGVLGLAQGCRNIVLKDIDPAVILELIEKHKIESAFFVPAVILFLLSMPNVRDVDFSSLKMVLYGASPIAEDLLRQAQEVFDCQFIQLYGMTETNGAGTFLPPDDHAPERNKLRSCGKASPGNEIRIIGEDGKDAPAGAVGEILIRTGASMKGYWKRPEATEETLVDGWIYTGDAGFLDEEGYLYIHDRVKDMIVSGGENVYPAEVENALFNHPAIADVAVIGVPDQRWGEAVKAVVVVKPGEELSEQDVIAYAKTQIAGYKVPKSVDFIDALPRNPSGKILRRELREPYWEGQERRVG